MKVLHVLYTSLPDSSGSSIRSRGVIESQKAIGVDPVVITSPFQKPFHFGEKEEINNSIKYIRTYNGEQSQEVSESTSDFGLRIKKAFQIYGFFRQIIDVSKRHNVKIIHSHATFFCGLSGLFAAKKLKIPMVYEMRSLWEERSRDREGSLVEKVVSIIIRYIETFVMKRADRVVVISEALKNNIIDRGIPENKIIVIGNAIEKSILEKGKKMVWPVDPERSLVFAYVGSVSPIEGLHFLLDAWRNLKLMGENNKLEIHGDGIEKRELERLTCKYELDNVKFFGAFSPSDAETIYKRIDVIINPRCRSNLSDTVTPLKPLEAMAYRKLVVVSDVGGMKELVSSGKTALIFGADDKKDLLKTILFILKSDLNDLSKIVENGQSFVEKCRSWEEYSKKYQSLYISLLTKKASV